MKLFYQLSEKTQNEVLHHCANIVMQDMIDDGIKLEPLNDEEASLKEKLEDAIKHIKTISSKEEKTNYLLGDAVVSRAIYDIALEMAKGAFYHDDSELVIYPDSLGCDHDDETNLLPETTAPKKKKVSELN